MKLMHAMIYGFGKWYDYSIDFSTNPFLRIYGENESGKSTLHHFILFMLFGLPPKKRAFFRPKTGGKMGGRLTIYDVHIGEFTIERFDDRGNGAAKCYTPNGQEFDEAWLKERLNGMTHKTYQSIFSFSALDLSLLNDMKEEDLGEVLLGIGLTGSKNIYSIEKRIDTQIGELFKPYGKKPAINQQLDSLDALFFELTKYKNEETTYREKKETIHTLTEAIRDLKEKLNQENQLLSSIEKQQQAVPLINAYHHHSNQLAHYPSDIAFPEDGLHRLQALKEKILPIQSEQSILEDNLNKYREKQANLRQELYEEHVYLEAKNILRNYQDYIDVEKEINRQQESVKRVEIQIENELSQLNIGLDVNHLSAISFPFHIENTWNELKNNSRQLQLENEQLQEEGSSLTNQRDYLVNQNEEIEAALLSDNHVSELNETINEYNQQTTLKKLKEDSLRQHDHWQQVKVQKRRKSTHLLVGSIILAVVSGIAALFLSSTILYGVMAILIVGGVIQWAIGKQSISNMEHMLKDDPIYDSGIHVTKEMYEEAEILLARNDKRLTEWHTIQDQLKAVDIKLLQLDERKNIYSHKEKRFEQTIEEQCVEYPFLRRVDLTYWPQFYHTMKHLLQKNESRLEMEKHKAELEHNQKQFHQVVTRFVQEQNGELVNKTVHEQIEGIQDLVEHTSKTVALIEQYDKWIHDAAEQYQELKQKKLVYENETKTLYNVAAVETEEAFFQKARKWNDKRKLEEKINELLGQLLATFSQSEWDTLADKNIDANVLESMHEDHVAIIKSLEDDLENKRQQLAVVNAELAKMETSETHSKTIHRFHMEQEQLYQLAKNWAVLKTAKEMLGETKRKFRDKYLAKVVDKTSYYFSVLTNHTYKQVIAPTVEQVFQVLSADDLKYTVKELSQGTTDQLYIALRIAISEVMSENHRLPFIIDDAFVHFDGARTKQMMKIFSEIAVKHQVILFTCKKEIVETENKGEIVFLENTVRIN